MLQLKLIHVSKRGPRGPHGMDPIIPLHLKSDAHIWLSYGLVWFGLVQVDFTHTLPSYFTGAGAVMWLPQWKWNNTDEYG